VRDRWIGWDFRHRYDRLKLLANNSGLLEDLILYFQVRQEPAFATLDHDHGRIETRQTWTTSALNGYLDFPDAVGDFMGPGNAHQPTRGTGRCPTSPSDQPRSVDRPATPALLPRLGSSHR
jgi:hypothetical protein